jgi:phage terminase large subunit
MRESDWSSDVCSSDLSSLDVIFGQDFGFASDPSTLVKIAVDEGKKIIYLDECFYKNGLTTNSLFELNRQYAGNRLIVADRSNPRLIDELKALGNNIVPAVSADGSGVISTGLLTMQDYMIIVTENSTNLMTELKTYVWLDERGKLAIDKFNHAIDAARYGFMYVKHQSRHKFYAV